ncbi:TylF/MycF/NovP-related O-methyltransferase [Marivirga arenosa]|uniref:TylF/MycF/NovP-related O-methyltransferase n=1 Tax=Marivirga arenosa TaxID=3059076 RepID=A0AA52F090_9BACT|nr:TylF/MycF/NovP-related O-methyltransferase [Marivirga sp. BKB1-2]WNB18068.1 TylF/MycF/NovP-related O-methyltransferase [Marivirga sp. BKB1-2]
MKNLFRKIIRKIGYDIKSFDKFHFRAAEIQRRFSDYTMIPKMIYFDNLSLVSKIRDIDGVVVECGVWRGGMIAGIAELMPEREYFLFDSFEGLPKAKEIDGQAAQEWQKDISSPKYYDNCKAEMKFADEVMKQVGVKYELVRGWFKDTIPKNNNIKDIALLRLDADWYDSTIVCLEHLYPRLKTGGLLIIDDYFSWDGCSRAIHDYLSSIKSKSRINRTQNGVCYILKND